MQRLKTQATTIQKEIDRNDVLGLCTAAVKYHNQNTNQGGKNLCGLYIQLESSVERNMTGAYIEQESQDVKLIQRQRRYTRDA